MRLRGVLLMAAEQPSLGENCATTGNKVSEVAWAMRRSTGDMAGATTDQGTCYKTRVFRDVSLRNGEPPRVDERAGRRGQSRADHRQKPPVRSCVPIRRTRTLWPPYECSMRILDGLVTAMPSVPIWWPKAFERGVIQEG